MTAIVYRITLTGKGKKRRPKTLYLRRIVGPCTLWHPDLTLAMRYTPAAADRLAEIMRQRSIRKNGTEPPGAEYGVLPCPTP